jgi:molybdopterin-guanine dinucleotide biosynthesis protein B
MSLLPAHLLGFAAYSGTGKTTLLRQLIPLLKGQGLRVGLIKKSHHDFEIDQAGKDSHTLRLAGASPVMLTSAYRRAVITDYDPPRERSLAEELACFDPTLADIILVEGYKHERFPKIELHRPALGRALLFPDDPNIIAIACDGALAQTPPIPQFDLNAPRPIADFILDHLRRHASA